MLFIPVTVTVGAGENEKTMYSAGPAVFGKKLEALARTAGDLTEPLTAIADDLRDDVLGAFQTEGAYDLNPPWRQLSEPYGTYKQGHVPGVPILVGIKHTPKGTRQSPNRGGTWQASGLMRRQLLDPAATLVSPRRLLYAPVSDYAGYHETGTSRMPARPPVQINPTTLAKWDSEWVRWLDRLVKQVGL